MKEHTTQPLDPALRASLPAVNAGHTMVDYRACVECGSCRVGCPFANIGWSLPRGGYGIAYKFG